MFIKMLIFGNMNYLRRLFANWREQVKFSISDPLSFNETFGFTTSKIRALSLFLLMVFLLSALFVILLIKGPFKRFVNVRDEVDKQLLMEQKLRVDSLSATIEVQDRYIANISNILSGKVNTDTVHTEPTAIQIDPNKINASPSKAEEQLALEVKEDQYTTAKKDKNFVHFLTPVVGKVSQKFKLGEHEALDIVTPLDAYFSACLPGTVIYTGFSQKDGNFMIIAHANEYVSVYKHAKTLLKSRGDVVGVGDMIGIVGNSGSNSTGPHLHFELWLNQKPVNPELYMKFN